MIKRKDGFSGERALVLPTSIVREMEKDALSRTLHITDIGYYPRAKHHFRKRDIAISQYIFIYCVEGKGWFDINDKHYAVEQNQCFILPPNVPHSYGADKKDPWTIYWIHFKGELAAHYATRLLNPVDIKPGVYSRINGRLNLFEEVYHTLELGYSKENVLYACSALHYFLGSICFLQQYRNATSDNQAGDVVENAIHYMKENIEKKLTVADFATYTGFSVSHFSSLFNSRTGYSPVNYFNLLKIQHACYLLDHTDMRVNQVCYKIGIEDCYYFSRIFSKMMGLSPSEYKKQKKG